MEASDKASVASGKALRRIMFWVNMSLIQQWKIYVPSTLLKNCLKFYLAKYTVNISALQHYRFLQLQLICLCMSYLSCFPADHSYFGLFFFPHSLPVM